MLKVIVFDGGYGGEFLADKLAEELPVVDIIRVIDWRNADPILFKPRLARKIAEAALAPYIGRADLIIFGNYLISLTSLGYFQNKYPHQKFIGLQLKQSDSFISRDTLILSTSALTRTPKFLGYVLRTQHRVRTLTLDSWPHEIDEGTLSREQIRATIEEFLAKKKFRPEQIILTCSQFDDIKEDLIAIFGHKVKIYDGFEDTIRSTFKALGIRGGLGKKRKK